jgi:hypothetical protein
MYWYLSLKKTSSGWGELTLTVVFYLRRVSISCCSLWI